MSDFDDSQPPLDGDPPVEHPQPEGVEAFEATKPVGQGEYEVKEGDCISSIAKDHGYFWETIWNDPANAELQSARKDPNILLPGDRVTLPAREPKQESGQTEMRHRFVRRGEPASLVLRIQRDGKPRANVPYVLTVDQRAAGSVSENARPQAPAAPPPAGSPGDPRASAAGQRTFTGLTDADGKIEVFIPNNARRGVLEVGTVPERDEYIIGLGKIDPIDTWSGVQARLKNLGYACEPTGQPDGPTLEALKAFQADERLEQSGDMDEPTRARLRERHGC